jgi:mannose-6-phosphate isomerase-like protein (cupin superfamily)
MLSTHEHTEQHVVIRQPGQGQLVSLAGTELIFKATAEDTAGKYALCEYLAPPGWAGPPPHTHGGFDELWYVLEGELTMQAGEETVLAGAGAFVHVPGATLHCFANRSQAPVKFLLVIMPGGFERYFLADLPEVIAQHGYPPPRPVMAELAHKYGLETLQAAPH